MRAVEPVEEWVVDRDGIAIHYEVYGAANPTVYLLMPDVIVQSRAWKAQIPFLSRFFRVVVSDPRGNGRSGASGRPRAEEGRILIDDEWAVLDALSVERALLVGGARGGPRG